MHAALSLICWDHLDVQIAATLQKLPEHAVPYLEPPQKYRQSRQLSGPLRGANFFLKSDFFVLKIGILICFYITVSNIDLDGHKRLRII